MIDWQDTIIHMLIDGGVIGVKEQELTKRVRDYVDTEDAVMFLEFLQAQGKVDRYFGDKTMWRATSRIRHLP